MKLDDMFDLQQLEDMIDKGYVTRRWHRDYDLAILNYTDKAQYDNVWNEVTRQCRGLIYRPLEDNEVIARPFPKFFNYGQPGADEIDLDERALVTDKMDGSLGILYRTPDGCLSVATRGSFHSEQAEWATAWLHEVIEPEEVERLYRWSDNFTDMFEIIYPENRIVVDYGEAKMLVYLGSIHDNTGGFHRFTVWGAPESTPLARSLREALDLEPRENAEGVVVMTGDGRAVKIKQEDYLAKHRARFSLTPMRVWEAWGSGMTVDDFTQGLPDEFHDSVLHTWGGFETDALALEFTILAAHATVPDLGPETTRAHQAAHILEHYPDLAPGVFALLDDKKDRLHRFIDNAVKPTGPAASMLIA